MMARANDRGRRRGRVLAAAVMLLPTPALAAVYNLSNQTVDVATATYTADDTLNCSQVTFTSLITATLPASVNLGSGSAFSNAGDVTLAGFLGGSGFSKSGTGTLTLSADNTSYAGTITVTGGSLRLGNAAGAGNSGSLNPNSFVRVSTGGEFDLNGFAPPRVQVVFAGGSLVNNNTTTPVTLSSTSLPVLDTSNGPITLGGTGEIIANRSLSTVTKTGSGVLTLNLASGASGAWTINGGSLRLGKSNAFASGASVTANLGGVLDLNGFSMPAGVSVTLNDGGIVNNNIATPVTLNAAPSYAANSHAPRFGGDGTLYINFSSFPSSSTVHKVGAGLMTIPTTGIGASLSVDAGFVQIETNAQLGGMSTYTYLDGGGIRVGPLVLAPLTTYTLSRDIAIEPRGGIIDTQANTVLTGRLTNYDRPMGTLTKTGPANLYLNWSGGDYLYNYPIIVNQGTLSLRNPSYNLSQTPLTLNADNALTGSTAFTLGALAGSGAISSLSITTGALNLSTTYSGAFTNGYLTTTGTGTLTLTGAVAANQVFVKSGTLQIGDGGVAGSVSSPISLYDNSQVTFNRSDSVTHTGTFSVFGMPGTLNKLGASTLTLTQTTGPIKLNVAGGTLAFAPSLASTPRPVSLTIAPGAGVDITSNKLILNYTGASPFSTVRQYVVSHQLFSSTADADSSGLSVACVEASVLLGLSGSQTAVWGGQTVDAGSLLVAAVPVGDANFDGAVTGDDYVLIDRAFAGQSGAVQWVDGDFNYDGVVDQNDYLLIDTAYGRSQGLEAGLLAERESRFGEGYVERLVASVPEPGVVVGLVPLVLGWRGRRKRENVKT